MTPVGYFMEISLGISSGGGYYLFSGVMLLWFISMCIHHQAFYQMFLHYVHQSDALKENKNLNSHLCELVEFHISVKT